VTLQILQVFAHFGALFRVFANDFIEFLNFEIVNDVVSFVILGAIAQFVELFLDLLDAGQHFARLDLVHDLFLEFDCRQILHEFECLVDVLQCFFRLVKRLVRNRTPRLSFETNLVVALDAVVQIFGDFNTVRAILYRLSVFAEFDLG